jgi:hypothetical protein
MVAKKTASKTKKKTATANSNSSSKKKAAPKPEKKVVKKTAQKVEKKTEVAEPKIKTLVLPSVSHYHEVPKSFTGMVFVIQDHASTKEPYLVCTYWYKNGKHHREDGPASIFADGSVRYWCKNGKKHRLDGPACVYKNGPPDEYWIDGKEYSLKEWMRLVGKTPSSSHTEKHSYPPQKEDFSIPKTTIFADQSSRYIPEQKPSAYEVSSWSQYGISYGYPEKRNKRSLY